MKTIFHCFREIQSRNNIIKNSHANRTLLRDSEHVGDFTADDVARLARTALGADVGGYRADFLELVEQTR